jgi:signal transduction histidine kinase
MGRYEDFRWVTSRALGFALASAGALPVLVDTAEVGRALRNLMINAIRHTPSDSAVEVMGD